MADKSIEIIIPVRNMGQQLAKALQTLTPQLTEADTLTVVDDASGDDTARVAAGAGANVITLRDSRGPYFARQVAAMRSSADVLLFIDGRCRALPGLLDAHRRLHADAGTALSCTDVRTAGGPTLAARVAALQQPFSLAGKIGTPGRPDFYPTANLGVSATAFAAVEGFRAMRSGADADICWRIQNESHGRMAVDTRTLMEWEPRATMRDLASQWKRYGASTAYLEWLYGDISPSTFGTPRPLPQRLWLRIRSARDTAGATVPESMARLAITAVYQYGYTSAKRKSREFVPPAPYRTDELGAMAR
ncbi:MAG: glycosyltransferase [Actinobacteria bacterium]|nr:glycosyltransferase [Actinomycetota bacterium]